MSKKTEGMAASDYLPVGMARSLRREVGRTLAFGGCSAPFRGGEVIAEGVNLSPRRAPLLATRPPRGLFVRGQGNGKPHGMVWFDGFLIFARGTGLYATADGTEVHFLGSVSDTDKSFFEFGGRLYIYPDKLVMDRGITMPRPIELDTGVMEAVEFKGNTVTLPDGNSWSELGFAVGDCLWAVNADDQNPAPEGYYRITGLHAGKATLASTFVTSYTSNARFRRVVPALTRCCVSGDRVYGIIGKEIYVSGAGSATDFYSRPVGDGKHPVILRCESGGDFTALSPWQGYTVFFKPDRICKLLGSRSDSFTLRESHGAGIPEGFGDTLREVENSLYYASFGGIYRYRGQDPERVSFFGEVTVTEGHGGSDGSVYCLSMTADGEERVRLLLPEEGVWYPEDDLAVGFVLGYGGFLYLQDGEGNIWKISPEGRATGCAFTEEQIKGALVSSATLVPDHFGEPDGYRLVGLAIRATGEIGGTLRVWIRYDGSAEEVLLGKFDGGVADELLRISPLPRPCDGSVLRLEMTGDWVIHAVMRTYERRGQ